MAYMPYLSIKSRKNYHSDDEHLAFSDLLMPALEDGMNSFLSFDINLPDRFFGQVSYPHPPSLLSKDLFPASRPK